MRARTAARGPSDTREKYDLAAPITIKGSVARIGSSQGASNAYIYLDVDGGGKPERWVVEGDAPAALVQNGWRLGSRGGTLSLGQVISVTAFRARPGVDPLARAPVSDPMLVEAAKSGRLVRGGDVTLADGKVLKFSTLE